MSAIMVLLAHYLGDYGLQTDYMAEHKGRDWYVLFAHAAVWTFAVASAALFTGLHVTPLVVVVILLVPHMLIDMVKARKMLWVPYMSETGALLVDQSLHMVQLGALLLLCR